jgi:hypothetical protein
MSKWLQKKAFFAPRKRSRAFTHEAHLVPSDPED